MQTAALFFLLLAIPFDIDGQYSTDNGEIVVNNQGLLDNLVSTGGGIAAANGQITVEHIGGVTLNGPAPRPKDRIGGRRRKRQQAGECSSFI